MNEKAVWETGNINEFENAVCELFEIIKQLNGSTVVVGLVGDLGAGKTTLSKIVAKQMGIQNDVVSPTFNIMKIYKTDNSIGDMRFENFIHIDAYRIDPNNFEEVESLKNNLKINDLPGGYFAMSNTLVFVEWPQNIKSILPITTHYVEIRHDSENIEKRQISLY